MGNIGKYTAWAGARPLAYAGLAAAALLAATPGGRAQGLTDSSLYRSAEYQQTGPTTVVPYNGGTNYFFSTIGDVTSATTFDPNGMSITVPTSPSTKYTMPGPSGASPFINYSYESGFQTLAGLNTLFPTGTYTQTATNTGTGGQVSVNLTYNGTDYYSAAPQLTAASYNSLQHANPSQAITLNWAKFNPAGAINTALIFLNIYDLSTGGNDVFSDEFQSASATGLTVPANTLAPNQDYYEELVFSSRIDTTDAATIDANCTTNGPSCPGLEELAWDTRTLVDFDTPAATPAPEPATIMLFGVGLAGLAASRRRARN